jgi:predicted aspartyl protease
MPILTLPLEIGGAIIDVGFAVSGPRQEAMRKAGLKVPPPVLARALVDTGASCTCLDPAVIGKLGLVPSGTASIHTPSTGCKSYICNQFDVAVGIVMDAKQVHLSSLIIPVIESDLNAQGFQALLGRDVLDQGILIYDGHRRLLTLAF